MSNLHEECGVFGIYAPQPIAVGNVVYYGLYALQHRGQESCGIVVNKEGIFYSHKDLGLVSEVFADGAREAFPQAQLAVGHVRYGTTGATNRLNCQPIEVNHKKGKLALAHNGNLTNSYELRDELESCGAIFHTTSDTETIAYIITNERLRTPSIEAAVEAAMYRIKGAYSLVMMSTTKLIAARDPQGFRPLCFGRCADGSVVVASESCALAAVGARFERDIEPGEIVVFDADGERCITTHCGSKQKSLCVFEYIYFARPDSVIDGITVHEARVNAGRCLAKAHPVDADIVIGVPDSGLDAALGYSMESGIPYEIGFIKNKYIGRTFIAPGQEDRIDKVKIKLQAISSVVAGKRVVMIDDSIVRGTTCARIVGLLREAGAAQVHVRISAPPFTHPCYYGTDIDTQENLIACQHPIEEIAGILGADSLGYLPQEDLPALAGGSSSLCSGCFNGNYPAETPQFARKYRFE